MSSLSLAKLAQYFPRLSFGDLPTPVHRMNNLSNKSGAELWVKRDDLSGDLYGGNRVRQLEFLLADARKRGHKRILSAGGVGSNYIVAVAAYGRQVGISLDGIMIDQPPTLQVRRNLLLAHHFG